MNTPVHLAIMRSVGIKEADAVRRGSRNRFNHSRWGEAAPRLRAPWTVCSRAEPPWLRPDGLLDRKSDVALGADRKGEARLARRRQLAELRRAGLLEAGSSRIAFSQTSQVALPGSKVLVEPSLDRRMKVTCN